MDFAWSGYCLGVMVGLLLIALFFYLKGRQS